MNLELRQTNNICINNKLHTYQQKVQNGGIGEEGSKNEEHAGNHPRGYGSHAFYIWRDIGDSVENVDEHQEERYKEGHTAWHYLWRNQKAHPGDHNEQSTGEVVNVQISGELMKKNKTKLKIISYTMYTRRNILDVLFAPIFLVQVLLCLLVQKNKSIIIHTKHLKF